MREKGLFVSISSGVKPPDYAVDRPARPGPRRRRRYDITIDSRMATPDRCTRWRSTSRKNCDDLRDRGQRGNARAVIDLENWGPTPPRSAWARQGVSSEAQERLRHGGWQLSADEVVCASGDQPDHCRTAAGSRRHREERAFGASMVMIGSRFAGHEESPGRTVEATASSSRRTTGRERLQQGEYNTSKGKAHLEDGSGPLADTWRRNAGRRAKRDQLRRGRSSSTFRKVNYVILGGDNAGEHLLMSGDRARGGANLQFRSMTVGTAACPNRCETRGPSRARWRPCGKAQRHVRLSWTTQAVVQHQAAPPPKRDRHAAHGGCVNQTSWTR